MEQYIPKSALVAEIERKIGMMIKWLKSFLETSKPYRCEHQWKCVHQLEERIFDEPWDKYPSEINLIKTWECQKCGEIKETIIRKL